MNLRQRIRDKADDARQLTWREWLALVASILMVLSVMGGKLT